MDMLVKLYDLKPDAALDARMERQRITIRRVLPPELKALTSTGSLRASVLAGRPRQRLPSMRQPPTCFVAIQNGNVDRLCLPRGNGKGLLRANWRR